MLITVRGCAGVAAPSIAALFRHDGSTDATTVRFNFSESCHILHLHVVGGMRTGSSTNFAVDLCARRVGRIQENCRLHFAASDRRATRDGDFKMRVLVPPQQVALCFRTMNYELREQTGAFS